MSPRRYVILVQQSEALFVGSPQSLAANNKDIHRKIDSVLERNGSVRLVYGYYLGNIKDRDIIKENYRISAGRLIDSCCNHILSIYRKLRNLIDY